MLSRKVLLLSLLIPATTTAFHASLPQRQQKQQQLLPVSPLRVTYNDMEDLQKKRGEFENLMKDQKLQHNGDNAATASSSKQPILTTAGRRRRELEIEMLDSLRHSDDAVDELMHLWLYEHTVDEAHVIEAMEEHCSDGLVIEERMLNRMIHENPHWAEPRVRLATLLLFKGQIDESYRCAVDAQHSKPWHFEVYQLLVMLSLRMQDMGQALYWARLGLPQLRDGKKNTRRKEWVARSVQLATEQWQEAERATEAYLSSSDDSSGSTNNNNNNNKQKVTEEESWQ